MNAERARLDKAIDDINSSAAAWEPHDCERMLARLCSEATLTIVSSPVREAIRKKRARWALAVAGVAAAMALAVWIALPGAAMVVSSDGVLQGPNGPLAIGAAAPGGLLLQTGANADAMIRLGDGSVIELAARSAIKLTRGWSGQTIALEGGRVLVEAAKQGYLRHLYVATADCQVAVKGTIFEVDRMPAGSRVSVVQGLVRVTTSRRRRWLAAGDQATSNIAMKKLPVGADVAWSKNAPFYWAILNYMPPSPAPSPTVSALAPSKAPLLAEPPSPAPAEVTPTPPQHSVAPPSVAQAPQAPKPKVAPQKTAPPPDPTLVLFQQAANGIRDVPDELEPGDLLDLATAEDIRHPDLGRDTVVRAFHAALDLSSPQSDDDALGQWHAVIKANVELEAMTLLTDRSQDFETAHQLARNADTRRGRLYDELIASAWGEARAQAGARQPLEQALLSRMFGGIGYTPKQIQQPKGIQPKYDVLTLANECYQADGSFPYLGVSFDLGSFDRNGGAQRPLLLAAYHAAAGETDLVGMIQASNTLHMGHRVYPNLDAQMESAAVSLLQHIQQAVQSPPTGGIPAHQQYVRGIIHEDAIAANGLLTLLQQVDPARGAELSAEYSEFSADVPPKPYPISALTARQRQANADPAAALTTANAMPNISDQQKMAKFLALAHLAIVLAKRNPGPASQAASSALNLLTDDITSAHVDVVGLLALRIGTDLGEPDQAEALMGKALDAAEALADAKEQAYDNASDPVAQRTLSDDFNGVGAPEVEVFAYAGLLDPVLATQRAEQTSATYFKPLFLMRVAVGEEMKQPWWQ